MRIVVSRAVSAKLRAHIADHDWFCQMCGITPEDIDPYTGRAARLHIAYIEDKIPAGEDEQSKLRALCSTCKRGVPFVTAEKPNMVGYCPAKYGVPNRTSSEEQYSNGSNESSSRVSRSEGDAGNESSISVENSHQRFAAKDP